MLTRKTQSDVSSAEEATHKGTSTTDSIKSFVAGGVGGVAAVLVGASSCSEGPRETIFMTV